MLKNKINLVIDYATELTLSEPPLVEAHFVIIRLEKGENHGQEDDCEHHHCTENSLIAHHRPDQRYRVRPIGVKIK